MGHKLPNCAEFPKDLNITKLKIFSKINQKYKINVLIAFEFVEIHLLMVPINKLILSMSLFDYFLNRSSPILIFGVIFPIKSYYDLHLYWKHENVIFFKLNSNLAKILQLRGKRLRRLNCFSFFFFSYIITSAIYSHYQYFSSNNRDLFLRLLLLFL